MAAAGGLGVAAHGVEVLGLAGDQSLGFCIIEVGFGCAFSHQRLPAKHIGRRIEQHAFCGQAIAARAACLLLVGLKALGERRMEHQPYVGAIDSHAKGNRCHHDVDRLSGKGFLRFASLRWGESCVVGASQNSLGGKSGCELFGFAARDAVDDRSLAGVPPEDLKRLSDAVGARDDAVAEVGSIERAQQHLGIAQVELRHNVVSHSRCGGGGEGVEARGGKSRAEHRQLSIFWAEVVSPVANAVRLINGKSFHAHLRQDVE